MSETARIAVFIARKPSRVYEYASNPVNLPLWAAGLARSKVKRAGKWWEMAAPFGKVRVRFAPKNASGVMDHEVELESGEVVLNPMRVVPRGGASELIFTLVRRPGMTERQFLKDKAAVAKDLRALKKILESAAKK